MKHIIKKLIVVLIPLGLYACAAEQGGDGLLGRDGVHGNRMNLPFVDDRGSSDPNHLTVAATFVEFIGADGKPVLDTAGVQAVTERINTLYAACNMHIRVEKILPVRPQDYGLDYSTASMADLDPIRSKFDSPQELVVINTGPWNHGGMGSANAWTSMPGYNPSGAVIEAPVAGDGNIVAHELGHYLNLDHVNDTGNMMNPIIYRDSTRIDSGQCASMRQAALTIRSQALR